MEAAGAGAQVISLPECFNSPYGIQFFSKYAEPIPDLSATAIDSDITAGESIQALSKMARDAKVYLIGGSIPEICMADGGENKFYNTCTVYDPDGKMVSKHRKIHLFDINLPTMKFQESKVLLPGQADVDSMHSSTFVTPWLKIGLGICYDIRFPELAHLLTSSQHPYQCQMLVYPGAFNMTTGPLHWELLQRSRALDNQVFVAACSPARDTNASYTAWGHSTVCGPDGRVLAKCEHGEAIVYCDIEVDELQRVRSGIPILQQKRFETSVIKSKSSSNSAII